MRQSGHRRCGGASSPVVTKQQVITWITRLSEVYRENCDYLTQLDAAIGDADHGINMERGFTKVTERISMLESQSIGDILRNVGMILVSSVGGASGPLYGTFFLRAGMAIGEREKLDNVDVVSMFESGLRGVIERGRAELQDKTMVDAMQPGLHALKSALEEDCPLGEALLAASYAAKEGMEKTIALKARKGRASYLGDRSIGHQDPGATSAYLLFQAAADCWGSER